MIVTMRVLVTYAKRVRVRVRMSKRRRKRERERERERRQGEKERGHLCFGPQWESNPRPLAY